MSEFAARVVDVHVGHYLWNTIIVAFGSWLTQIMVVTTGGYALSVLRLATER